MELRYMLFDARVVAPVSSVKDAVREYVRVRDAFGVGASELSAGEVREGRRLVARISYNGEVWGHE